MSPEGKIQQQIYTRGREGIFRTNEGLDTVAKSPSLDNGFIRKTLHPFCLYHAPQELRQRGETDLSLYPDSLTVFTADSGELVIGHGIFAGADFTGQRDTILVHQYVVPESLKESFYRTPDALFRIRSFESTYKEGEKQLPELDRLDFDEGPSPEEERRTLDRLGVTEERFKQLLAAILQSVASNKKVYIALDTDVSDTSRSGKLLLAMLYRCLPYVMRRKFGFTSYQNEPQGKKWINAMIVEKGSIRAGDRSLDKDFVFDFPNGRFPAIVPSAAPAAAPSASTGGPGFPELAWASLEQGEGLEDFFAFAEEALADRDAAAQLSLSAYNELCMLYLVEQGSDGVYETNKEQVLRSVLGYLTADNVERKPRLDSLFWSLVEREAALTGQGYTPSSAYLQTMIDYYRIGGLRESLVFSLIKFLYNGWTYQEDSEGTNRVLQAMVPHRELFRDVVLRMLHNEPIAPIVHAYAQERTTRAGTMAELQDELTFWLEHAEEALSGFPVQEQFIAKARELLGKDKERIAAARSLNAFLDERYKSKTDYAKRLREFYNELDLQAQQTVMEHVDSNRISPQQLEGMAFMLGHHSQVLADSLPSREQTVFYTLQCASFLLRSPADKEAECYMTLDLLQPRELDQLQVMLQRLLKDSIAPERYAKIAYAFYERGTEPGDCSFAHAQMLEYVMRQAEHPDEVYDFLNWSAEYAYFLTLKRTITRDHEGAIRGYFHKMDHGALKKPKVWAKLRATPNPSFRKVYDDIRLAQSNPVLRFLKKKRRRLVPLAVLVVGIALLSTMGVAAYHSWFRPDEPVQQQPDGAGGQTEPSSGGGSPEKGGAGTGADAKTGADGKGGTGGEGKPGSGSETDVKTGTEKTGSVSDAKPGADGKSGTDTKTGTGADGKSGTDAKTGTAADGKSGTDAKTGTAADTTKTGTAQRP
ncbi:hypothetical protein ACFFNY_03760 [Paenibacillus hodogayensis]|uniref:Glycosyltransferase n=1 Tax=Paenibacillus hodogayensis TaxID=279208 RepID=A0ABV5VR88_9BACL